MYGLKQLTVVLFGLAITAYAAPVATTSPGMKRADDSTPKGDFADCAPDSADTVAARSIEDVGAFDGGNLLGCGM